MSKEKQNSSSSRELEETIDQHVNICRLNSLACNKDWKDWKKDEIASCLKRKAAKPNTAYLVSFICEKVFERYVVSYGVMCQEAAAQSQETVMQITLKH